MHLLSGEQSSKFVKSGGRTVVHAVFTDLKEDSHYSAHVLSLGRMRGDATLYFDTIGMGDYRYAFVTVILDVFMWVVK